MAERHVGGGLICGVKAMEEEVKGMAMVAMEVTIEMKKIARLRRA